MIETQVAVIGGGLAGATAALSALHSGAKVLLIEMLGIGGKLNDIRSPEELPGYPAGMTGSALAARLEAQLAEAGAEIRYDRVLSLEFLAGDFVPAGFSAAVRAGAFALRLASAETVICPSVVLASGMEAVLPGIPGIRELQGRGVSTCAACDASFFKDKSVVVYGGGHSAFDAADILAGHAASVTLVFPEDRPQASRHVVDRFSAAGSIISGLSISALRSRQEPGGRAWLEGLQLSGPDGLSRDLSVEGLFLYNDFRPRSGPVAGLGICDGAGYVSGDGEMATALPGLFAAGDVRACEHKHLLNIASDGHVAGMQAANFAGSRQGSSASSYPAADKAASLHRAEGGRR